MWGLIRDSSVLSVSDLDNEPEEVDLEPTEPEFDLEPTAASEWCQEQNSQLKLCVVVDIPESEWTEEQAQQTLVALVPGQRVFILDMKTNQSTLHTYVLTEWKKEFLLSCKETIFS